MSLFPPNVLTFRKSPTPQLYRRSTPLSGHRSPVGILLYQHFPMSAPERQNGRFTTLQETVKQLSASRHSSHVGKTTFAITAPGRSIALFPLLFLLIPALETRLISGRISPYKRTTFYVVCIIFRFPNLRFPAGKCLRYQPLMTIWTGSQPSALMLTQILPVCCALRTTAWALP